MAQETNLTAPAGEAYDIFLCTRELPDQLTAETAALRQLCAALIGSGYRVFFPPAALRGMETEERARAMAEAVNSTPVMIAAAVGDEGIRDEASRYLWDRFRTLSKGEPGRTFLACCQKLFMTDHDSWLAKPLYVSGVVCMEHAAGSHVAVRGNNAVDIL